jgi:general secretion pathway protein I
MIGKRSTSMTGRSSGFTLIEVMVALVIVALGMTAVHAQLGRYASTATIMEEKTLASWIAANKLTELGIAPSWPELGNDEEEIEFAGRYWLCRTEVTETEVENLRRVDISILLVNEPDRVVHEMMGLIEQTAPRGFAPLEWQPPRIDTGG